MFVTVSGVQSITTGPAHCTPLESWAPHRTIISTNILHSFKTFRNFNVRSNWNRIITFVVWFIMCTLFQEGGYSSLTDNNHRKKIPTIPIHTPQPSRGKNEWSFICGSSSVTKLVIQSFSWNIGENLTRFTYYQTAEITERSNCDGVEPRSNESFYLTLKTDKSGVLQP